MNLDGIDITPAENMLAVRFLENTEEEKTETSEGPASVPFDRQEEAIVALVVGVGKKVTRAKKGDTVLLRDYAKYAPRVSEGSDTAIVEDYTVLATLTP